MGLYPILAALHVGLGCVALASFWSAGLARKGSALHVGAGRVYLGSMALLLALALPMTAYVWAARGPVTGGFLAYLLIIVATSVWSAWRAIRDKRDWARYTGPVYRGLAWLNLGGALGVAALGILLAQQMQLVIVAFSLIGLIGFVQMRRFARRAPEDPRWWLREHLSAMLGNGVATHIAFLAIGLPRLVPALQNAAFVQFAWLAPLGIAALAGMWLTRKYLPKRPLPQRTATAPQSAG